MTDEAVRLRPGHVAGVWGKAAGQLVDLVVETWKAVMEFRFAESDIVASDSSELAIPYSGQPPQLQAGELRGETYGKSLPAAVVQFQSQPSPQAGVASFLVTVDEQLSEDVITGDIYRGDVVDENGARVAGLALDAGS